MRLPRGGGLSTTPKPTSVPPIRARNVGPVADHIVERSHAWPSRLESEEDGIRDGDPPPLRALVEVLGGPIAGPRLELLLQVPEHRFG